MIAAGVNAKALSTYMGHANISITLDRYGHLMPGNEEERQGCSMPTLNGRIQRAAIGDRGLSGEGSRWPVGSRSGPMSTTRA